MAGARRALLGLLLAAALAACGGGGSGDGGAPFEGTRQSAAIVSRNTGTEYPLSIYTPPANAGPRSALPVIYVLDGESWFETLVSIAESTKTRVIIVAIHGAGQRNRDFVPPNLCTPSGGGHGAYFQFLRQELLPYVESTIGGDPAQRTLFGHSHGGSFVLYAMFAEAPADHSFRAYWASDASVGCLPVDAYGWDQTYAARFEELPVRLHLSYASQGNYTANVEYSAYVAAEDYRQLVWRSQGYAGTHGGIVPQALADAVAFTFGGH